MPGGGIDLNPGQLFVLLLMIKELFVSLFVFVLRDLTNTSLWNSDHHMGAISFIERFIHG